MRRLKPALWLSEGRLNNLPKALQLLSCRSVHLQSLNTESVNFSTAVYGRPTFRPMLHLTDGLHSQPSHTPTLPSSAVHLPRGHHTHTHNKPPMTGFSLPTGYGIKFKLLAVFKAHHNPATTWLPWAPSLQPHSHVRSHPFSQIGHVPLWLCNKAAENTARSNQGHGLGSRQTCLNHKSSKLFNLSEPPLFSHIKKQNKTTQW